jgi:hypothetical protein
LRSRQVLCLTLPEMYMWLTVGTAEYKYLLHDKSTYDH